MAKKLLISILAIGFFASSSVFIQVAQAKTVKKMIVKSIDYTEKTLEAVKNGDTYAVNAANAKIRKGATSTKNMTFSKIEKGDVITVEGVFDDRNVTATKIRDLSYYDKKTVTFYGKIDSINTATNTIKIDPIDRTDQTVSVLSSTKIKNENGDAITLTSLDEDDRILVTGKWSRKKDTITKTKTIDLLDDDDYEDLDD